MTRASLALLLVGERGARSSFPAFRLLRRVIVPLKNKLTDQMFFARCFLSLFVFGVGVRCSTLICVMQVPDLTIWYGPDTYMGENLYNMLGELAGMADEQIGEVHPKHNQVGLCIFSPFADSVPLQTPLLFQFRHSFLFFIYFLLFYLLGF